MHDTITVGGGQVRPENAGLSRRHSVMRLIESWPPAQAGSGGCRVRPSRVSRLRAR